MDGIAIVWFGIAGGAVVFAVTLLVQRYIQRVPRAVQAGSSFAMFAAIMVLFAIGAAIAGYASMGSR